MNEEINYYQKYTGVYTTTIENEKVIPITLNGTTYRNNLDILNVYINGLKLSTDKYTITNSNITLSEELHIIGTKIEFEVLRSVVTTMSYDSLKGDAGSSTIIKRWGGAA